MDKIIKLKQMLIILKTLEIKPNYFELSRNYIMDRRIIKKYDNGYEGKLSNRIRSSKLDKYI
ncbi:MAG: hypothetical protein ACK5HP_03515 [Bacilli bacterium]